MEKFNYVSTEVANAVTEDRNTAANDAKNGDEAKVVNLFVIGCKIGSRSAAEMKFHLKFFMAVLDLTKRDICQANHMVWIHGKLPTTMPHNQPLLLVQCKVLHKDHKSWGQGQVAQGG